MERFPQCLYRAPGSWVIDGVGQAVRLVASEGELAQALADGWSESPVMAAAPAAEPAPVTEPEPEAPAPVDDRAALVAEAEALGIAVDKRWSVATLRTKIAEALA